MKKNFGNLRHFSNICKSPVSNFIGEGGGDSPFFSVILPLCSLPFISSFPFFPFPSFSPILLMGGGGTRPFRPPISFSPLLFFFLFFLSFLSSFPFLSLHFLLSLPFLFVWGGGGARSARFQEKNTQPIYSFSTII